MHAYLAIMVAAVKVSNFLCFNGVFQINQLYRVNCTITHVWEDLI